MFFKKKTDSVYPLVSVVVISYNQEKFIGAAIESVLAQTYQAWEMVCADDDSTDGTQAIITEYAAREGRIKAAFHQNGGLSYNRNAGLLSTGYSAPYVLFLDGDDTLSPFALELLVARLGTEPGAVAAVGRAEHIDENGLPCIGRFGLPEPRDGLKELAEMIERPWGLGMYPASIALYRRWAVEACGAYNVFQRACEDDDFAIRVALHGPFLFIPDVLTQYRRHAGNVTNDEEYVQNAYVEAVRRRPWYRAAWNAGRGKLLGQNVAPGDKYNPTQYVGSGYTPEKAEVTN